MGKLALRVLLGAMLIFVFITSALAEDFSADVVQVSGGQVFQGKIFVSKQKMRMEMPQMTSIARMDKGLVWILMPQEQMYMEQPFNPANMPLTEEKAPGEIERRLLLLEKLNGRMTEKYRVVYEFGGQRTVSFQWVDKEMGIPVKSAAEDGSWSTEYRNIKSGPQPAVLFEIPAGYKKFSYGQEKLMEGWE